MSNDTKERDTNSHENVEMEAVFSIISGKWTLRILFKLLDGTNRFNELQRKLEIAPSTLNIQLKKLEKAQIVVRKEYFQIPAKVEYSLSDIGMKLYPILVSLEEWTKKYNKKINVNKMK